VVRRVLKAFRDFDPNRLTISDGLWWGRDPVEELAPPKPPWDLGVSFQK
jgi:hypothetical protein